MTARGNNIGGSTTLDALGHVTILTAVTQCNIVTRHEAGIGVDITTEWTRDQLLADMVQNVGSFPRL